MTVTMLPTIPHEVLIEEDLEQARRAPGRLKKIEEQIATLEASKVKISARYSDLPRGGQGCDLADVLNEIEKLKQDYLDNYRAMVALRRAAYHHIKHLTGISYDILSDRYLSTKTWEQLEHDYHYTRQRLCQIKTDAIRLIAEREKI